MFAVSLITIDRSPKQNFLGTTLRNLERAGVFASPLCDSFTIYDSGSPSTAFIQDLHFERHDTAVDAIDTAPRTPTQNAAAALRGGSKLDSPWVLFLEDDIDVCGQFLESVSGWLGDHAQGFRVFPLGANYDMIKRVKRTGQAAWHYPVRMFYGTLAMAVRSADAASIADFLDARGDRHEYDLHIADWAREQGITEFLTPAPSFVQHIGTESFIRPGSEFHTYDSWPGHNWSYRAKVMA